MDATADILPEAQGSDDLLHEDLDRIAGGLEQLLDAARGIVLGLAIGLLLLAAVVVALAT